MVIARRWKTAHLSRRIARRHHADFEVQIKRLLGTQGRPQEHSMPLLWTAPLQVHRIQSAPDRAHRSRRVRSSETRATQRSNRSCNSASLSTTRNAPTGIPHRRAISLNCLVLNDANRFDARLSGAIRATSERASTPICSISSALHPRPSPAAACVTSSHLPTIVSSTTKLAGTRLRVHHAHAIAHGARGHRRHASSCPPPRIASNPPVSLPDY